MSPLPVTKTRSPEASFHRRARCNVPLAMVLPNSKIRLEPCSALANHVLERVGEQLDLVVPAIKGGRSFTMFTLSAATCVRIRCRWNAEDHHLGEQGRTDCLDHFEAPAQARRVGSPKTSPDHQANPRTSWRNS